MSYFNEKEIETIKEHQSLLEEGKYLEFLRRCKYAPNSRRLDKGKLYEGLLRLGINAFEGCKEVPSYFFNFDEHITRFIVPEGLTRIDTEAFQDCYNLKSVTMNKDLKHIERGAFASCRKLNNLTLPEGLTTIGEKAFFSCNSLTDINIPSSVNYILQNAFSFCDKLTTIHYNGTKAEWKSIKKSFPPKYLGSDIEVICTNGSIYIKKS